MFWLRNKKIICSLRTLNLRPDCLIFFSIHGIITHSDIIRQAKLGKSQVLIKEAYQTLIIFQPDTQIHMNKLQGLFRDSVALSETILLSAQSTRYNSSHKINIQITQHSKVCKLAIYL